MQIFRRLFLAMAVSVLSACGAVALDRYEAAGQLANVLVSEELCGLSFDQEAISAWIEANVAADDMEFSGNLTAHLSISEYSLKDISASAKTAHCAQVRRVAKSFAFTDE